MTTTERSSLVPPPDLLTHAERATLKAVCNALLPALSAESGDDARLFALHAAVDVVSAMEAALVGVRVQAQRRELQSLLALQQTNTELRVVTERLQSELVFARDIQQSLLPPPSPNWPHVDVVCYSQPAREVGGDFYSYHTFSDGRLGLAVGDVLGKGVSAALLMASSLSLFNARLSHPAEPDVLFSRLDTDLLPYTRPRNQNCALCYIELDRQRLCIVNAGSIPPYIRRADGEVD